MALALAGIVMVFLPRIDRGSTEVVGLSIGLLSALFFVCYLLTVERRGLLSTVTILARTGLAAAIVLLP